MLPVALAIADECVECSEHLIEGTGKLDKRMKRKIESRWSFPVKESSNEIINIDEQPNEISRNKADNLKKSSIHYIID